MLFVVPCILLQRKGNFIGIAFFFIFYCIINNKGNKAIKGYGIIEKREVRQDIEILGS